jgi:hypothetical protein
MNLKSEDKSLAGFIPGYIEVLFASDFKINIRKGSKHPWNLRSGKGAPPKKLIASLEEIGCTGVSRLFTAMDDEKYDKLHKQVEEKRKKKGKSSQPNLKYYFAIHFSRSQNQKNTASMLKELCPKIVVESYAVAKPSLPGSMERFDLCRFVNIMDRCIRLIQYPGCPNTTPSKEPLIGDKDIIYADPARPDTDNQWYIYRTKADQAWTMACGKDIVIAQADWGFLTTHEELTNLDMRHAYNIALRTSEVSYFIPDDPLTAEDDTEDYRYHGTAVAGIMAAAVNTVGIAGFAYESSIWPIQAAPRPENNIEAWIGVVDWLNSIYDTYKYSTDYEEIKAIGIPPRILILEIESSGQCYLTDRTALKHAINVLAENNGVVVVLPAGNGNNYIREDEDDTEVIIVGATGYDASTNPRWDEGDRGSNWGTRVDMCAPGQTIVSSICATDGTSAVTNSYHTLSGTSFSAPMVAGTVAMMLQCNPKLEPDEVRKILISTGSEIEYGAEIDVEGNPTKPIGKFLNAYAAVREACRLASPEICAVPCRTSAIVGIDDFKYMMKLVPDPAMVFDPCKFTYIHYEDCIRQQIVIGQKGGPCSPETLIAAAPFRSDFSEVWKKVDKKVRKGKHLGHFKRLTMKEEIR